MGQPIMFSYEEIVAVLALSKDATAIYTTEDLIIQTANDAMIGFWGKDRSVIGKSFIAAVPELIGQPFFDLLREVWRTGITYEAIDTAAQLRVDGRLQWFYYDFIYRAIKNYKGEVYCILHTATDVTDRHRKIQEGIVREQTLHEELSATNEELQSANDEVQSANLELNQSKQELLKLNAELEQRVRLRTKELQAAIDNVKANDENMRNMVRQAPVGMCIVQGNPLYVVEINDGFLKLIGKARAELQKRPYWDVLSEAAAFYEPITNRVLATGETYHAKEHEIMLIRNGREEIVHVDFVYEPMKDSDGKPYAIMIVAIDITDKVLARRKVERAEESLRMAIDAAELGSYYINTEDRIFHPSPRLKEFFGFEPNEEVPYEAAIGQIHEDYRQAAADLVEAAITKGVRFDMEYPVVGYHDGRIRWVRGIGTVQKDNNGKSYFTGVLHEITERKQDEMRKNDFIGMVSHELKTPLTSLSAIIQVAAVKLKNSSDQFLTGAMEKANNQVKRMMGMINGFLNVSRLESGKILIEKHNIDICRLIADIVEETKMTTTSHTINFEPCESSYIKADPDKISSVISNLLSNAVKYSPKGNYVDIKCGLKDKKVLVSVRDEGIGIKPQDIGKIFERYYRVQTNHTQHISGFGIGLYLSAEIIKRHGGDIWAESEAGKGSTFYFSLPA